MRPKPKPKHLEDKIKEKKERKEDEDEEEFHEKPGKILDQDIENLYRSVPKLLRIWTSSCKCNTYFCHFRNGVWCMYLLGLVTVGCMNIVLYGRDDLSTGRLGWVAHSHIFIVVSVSTPVWHWPAAIPSQIHRPYRSYCFPFRRFKKFYLDRSWAHYLITIEQSDRGPSFCWAEKSHDFKRLGFKAMGPTLTVTAFLWPDSLKSPMTMIFRKLYIFWCPNTVVAVLVTITSYLNPWKINFKAWPIPSGAMPSSC